MHLVRDNLGLSFFVFYLIAATVGLMLLTQLLSRSRAREKEIRTVLDETREDLIRQMREAEHFRMACEHANDGIVIQKMNGVVVWPNPAYCRIMGLRPEDIIGRHPFEFALPPEDQKSAEEIAAFRYDPADPANEGLQLFRNCRANGELFWNQLNVSFRSSVVGEPHAILVCRDVTAQIEQEERLRETRNRLAHEASHDSLTDLSNRKAFLQFTKKALAKADKTGKRVGLLHVDLDRFKEINDTHGHPAGDAILSHVADTLSRNVRPTDLVARVGGDEFIVVCPDMPNLVELGERSAEITDGISTPLEWNNRVLKATCSVGSSLSVKGQLDPEDLLLQSDFALYEAKRRGRDCIETYDEKLHQRHAQQIHRASELADAIDTASLDHHYQPSFNYQTGQVLGFETLVRWNHPDEGIIQPDDFLPMAGELGLMGALDLGSMSSALEQIHRLDRAGFSDLSIAFNASADLLAHPEFINRLVWGVEAGGIDRSRVTIEVLETTAFGDASETSSHAAVIRDLRDAGFRIQLDDFGVGYAGLAHLAQLAVTGIKIDRTLIANMLVDDTSLKIVRKIIELGNDLSLDVIAEGVEDRQTADRLLEMGCQTLQGYWISRPLSQEDSIDWLVDQTTQELLQRAVGD